MNDTKPLQFYKDIPLKMNDTQKSNFNNPLQFYIGNTLKSTTQKSQDLIIHFNLFKEILQKLNETKTLQFI